MTTRKEQSAATVGPLTVTQSRARDNAGGWEYGLSAEIDGEMRVIAETFEVVGPGIKVDARANANLFAAADEMREALSELLAIIDAAGLNNLVNGVQLGAISWLVKATERHDSAVRALAKAEPRS